MKGTPGESGTQHKITRTQGKFCSTEGRFMFLGLKGPEDDWLPEDTGLESGLQGTSEGF